MVPLPFERSPFCLLRHSAIDKLNSHNRCFITTNICVKNIARSLCHPQLLYTLKNALNQLFVTLSTSSFVDCVDHPIIFISCQHTHHHHNIMYYTLVCSVFFSLKLPGFNLICFNIIIKSLIKQLILHITVTSLLKS